MAKSMKTPHFVRASTKGQIRTKLRLSGLTGTIDYALRPGIDLHGGFRSLNVSYGAPNANIKLSMYGPLLSATFRS